MQHTCQDSTYLRLGSTDVTGMPQPKKFEDTDLREAFAEGLSYRAIAERLQVHPSTIAHAVRRLGLPRRNTRLDDVRSRGPAIVSQYRDGASIASLSKAHDLDQRLVAVLLREDGVMIVPGATGSRNYQWRGGRCTTQSGYIKVRLSPEDPYLLMADPSGYVLEHRLAMAQSLARPLRSGETVHHLNGDRADNRLENLQLRQGKHGAGVALCCGDCGSPNVIPIPIPV